MTRGAVRCSAWLGVAVIWVFGFAWLRWNDGQDGQSCHAKKKNGNCGHRSRMRVATARDEALPELLGQRWKSVGLESVGSHAWCDVNAPASEGGREQDEDEAKRPEPNKASKDQR